MLYSCAKILNMMTVAVAEVISLMMLKLDFVVSASQMWMFAGFLSLLLQDAI